MTTDNGHVTDSPEEADSQRRMALANLVEFDSEAGFSQEARDAAYAIADAMATKRYHKDLIKAGRGSEIGIPDEPVTQDELATATADMEGESEPSADEPSTNDEPEEGTDGDPPATRNRRAR